MLREVHQDALLPKPNNWFSPGSQFFSNFYSLTVSCMHVMDLGHIRTLPVLSLFISQVLLMFFSPVCGTLSLGLLTLAGWEGWVTGTWETYQQLQHWRSRTPLPPQQPSAVCHAAFSVTDLASGLEPGPQPWLQSTLAVFLCFETVSVPSLSLQVIS